MRAGGSVGVVALQGDVAPHREAFAALGVDAGEVRRPADLDGLTHLVLPGGESTTLHHLLELFGLRDEIVRRHRAGELALFGTCAGAILLGRGDGERPPRFGLLDAVVHRNAYGRQVDSFSKPIVCEALGGEIHAVFIRAPKFAAVGPGARVVARDGDDPILVEGPGLLAATFHPELAGTSIVHQYFLRPELWQAASFAETRHEQTPEMVRA
jgi:pyridoxal 5'-phosphate synthase pdxT subunit